VIRFRLRRAGPTQLAWYFSFAFHNFPSMHVTVSKLGIEWGRVMHLRVDFDVINNYIHICGFIKSQMNFFSLE
jgi:hypothetical protein